MQDSEFVFSLVYTLFAFGIVYPPTEFESIGLTINNVFRSFLGNIDREFVQYHLRRTCLTLFVHTTLPLLYIVCYYLKFSTLFEYDVQFYTKFILWNSFVIFSIVLPVISTSVIYFRYKNGWKNHPLAQNLKKYSQNWHQAAKDINVEYLRDDKINMKTSAVHSVIATQNWIIKVSHFTVNVAHQSDTALIAVKSDSHDLSELSSETIQFVNIRVKPTRSGVNEFIIRINALDFKTLQDRMLRPISILDGVTFNKSVIDRFIEVFKQQVHLNPKYVTDEVTDLCFACMQAEPNMKLQKKCDNVIAESEHGPCTNCYCRPMWCIDCMAKWFASRQNPHEKDNWLGQKSSCPMCRAVFCILDVCYIEKPR